VKFCGILKRGEANGAQGGNATEKCPVGLEAERTIRKVGKQIHKAFVSQ
jgi:hypothetical protein